MLLVVAALAVIAFAPDVAELSSRSRERRRARRQAREDSRGRHVPDPGRELRAERKAEELLRGVVGERAFDAYRALGFLHIFGPPAEDGRPQYGYLIYPHRPIISFDADSRELLNEYCVSFPDRADPSHGERLPDADDVLAKWMALRGDERGVLAAANMHLPGRQVDPAQVRRDLARLGEWTESEPTVVHG